MSRKKSVLVSHRVTLILMLAIATAAAGCASTAGQTGPPVSVPAQPPASLAGEYGWWSVRFRMDRSSGKTRWEKDLLIAHRIFAPLILAYHDEIELWRFHRRSAEDEKGHQFSFLFYAPAETATHINRSVRADPLVDQLLASRLVAAVLTDSVRQNVRPAVGDTSDSNWSTVMQDAWPYYMMGVSRMWLEVIDRLAQETGFDDAPTAENLLAHYETVSGAVTRVWQSESQHALLHHLNAIFGYEAMIFHEKSWKTF